MPFHSEMNMIEDHYQSVINNYDGMPIFFNAHDAKMPTMPFNFLKNMMEGCTPFHSIPFLNENARGTPNNSQ